MPLPPHTVDVIEAPDLPAGVDYVMVVDRACIYVRPGVDAGAVTLAVESSWTRVRVPAQRVEV